MEAIRVGPIEPSSARTTHQHCIQGRGATDDDAVHCMGLRVLERLKVAERKKAGTRSIDEHEW